MDTANPVDTSKYKYLSIDMEVVSPLYPSYFEILWFSQGGTQWGRAPQGGGWLTIENNERKVYTVDLSTHPQWTGDLLYFRIDPSSVAGSTVKLHSVLLTTKPDPHSTSKCSLSSLPHLNR